MRVNKIKEKVNRGEVAFGGLLNHYCPAEVELVGALGFDWVFFDCEHGWLDGAEVENMVRAADLYGLTPVVRIPTNTSSMLHYLDLGVLGIVVPQMDTREQAERAVSEAKYYPLGKRGSNYGMGRNNNYGAGMKDIKDYYEASNRETMVSALIESVEGVKNIEEILRVPGLDSTWTGPTDLAQSMGMPPQQAIDEAVDKIVEATVRAGKISAVCHLSPIDTAKLSYFINKGVRVVGVPIGGLIKLGATEWLTKVREIASGLT